MKHRGVTYYPEAWPEERWDRDIELMQDAGINLVRMGEFAWSQFEPRKGEFTLDWWVDICERMRRAKIHVLACTPSAAPPAWLTSAHPETLRVDRNGVRETHGGRRHYCPSSPIFRERVACLNRKLANAVRDNPAIVAWQIDNEIVSTDACFCPRCTDGFRSWLQTRYGTLDALNEAWGNVFWSGDVSAWEEIIPTAARVSWKLDYQRYHDDVFTEFINEQAETLRAVNRDWRMTTNLWAGLNPAGNATQFTKSLDLASYDGYWEYYADREFYSAIWDFERNVKPGQPFWLTETGAWNSASTLEDGLRALRPWAYEALAKGADAQLYFRWRQSRMGEEDHPAVLDWSGEPGRPYAQVQTIFKEMESLGDALTDLPLPEAEVAILFDYDAALCGELEGRNYFRFLVQNRTILARMKIQADILPVRNELDLSAYRLVLLPQLEMVDPWLTEKLEDFVQTGGLLLAQTRLSTLDRNGKYRTDGLPGGLTDLFGVIVRERCAIQERSPKMMHTFPVKSAPASAHVEVAWLPDSEPGVGRAVEYMEMLEAAADCRTLCEYRGGSYAGSPAVVERSGGEGLAIYQACRFDKPSLRQLMTCVAEKAGVAVAADTVRDTEVLKRGTLRFYLNHSAQSVRLPQAHAGRVLLGRADGHLIDLEPFGVCIVNERVHEE